MKARKSPATLSNSPIKCFNRPQDQAYAHIYRKYHNSFNFYFAKIVNEILFQEKTPNVQKHNDAWVYCSSRQTLKRFYAARESEVRLKNYAAYYAENPELSTPHSELHSQRRILNKRRKRMFKFITRSECVGSEEKVTSTGVRIKAFLKRLNSETVYLEDANSHKSISIEKIPEVEYKEEVEGSRQAYLRSLNFEEVHDIYDHKFSSDEEKSGFGGVDHQVNEISFINSDENDQGLHHSIITRVTELERAEESFILPNQDASMNKTSNQSLIELDNELLRRNLAEMHTKNMISKDGFKKRNVIVKLDLNSDVFESETDRFSTISPCKMSEYTLSPCKSFRRPLKLDLEQTINSSKPRLQELSLKGFGSNRVEPKGSPVFNIVKPKQKSPSYRNTKLGTVKYQIKEKLRENDKVKRTSQADKKNRLQTLPQQEKSHTPSNLYTPQGLNTEVDFFSSRYMGNNDEYSMNREANATSIKSIPVLGGKSSKTGSQVRLSEKNNSPSKRGLGVKPGLTLPLYSLRISQKPQAQSECKGHTDFKNAEIVKKIVGTGVSSPRVSSRLQPATQDSMAPKIKFITTCNNFSKTNKKILVPESLKSMRSIDNLLPDRFYDSRSRDYDSQKQAKTRVSNYRVADEYIHHQQSKHVIGNKLHYGPAPGNFAEARPSNQTSNLPTKSRIFMNDETSSRLEEATKKSASRVIKPKIRIKPNY